MEELAAEFGLEKVDEARPLVRKVGWKTRETEAEREYWQTCDKPTARFFIEANPGYVEGDGLVTVVPVTASNMLTMFRNVGERRSRLDQGHASAQACPPHRSAPFRAAQEGRPVS